MDDPTPRKEGAGVLPPAEVSTSADAARPAGDGKCKLTVGARWRGFHVEAQLPAGPVLAFEATNIGLMEKVLIQATPITKAHELRPGVWQKLSTQLPAEARILKCIDAFTEDGWRYEVMNRPPPTALREWISSHHADSATQRLLLDQLAGALTALHGLGLVHLNVRPDTIYLDETADHFEIILGGLGAVTPYNQSQLTRAAIDPFYAPPEAFDADGLRPGIGLCAFDWWMVGRVLQEAILGRHVLSMLFGSDVIREPTPQLRAQAEALLLEREPPGLRPGAVETMSALETPVELMLRGLLTTARDARWGGDMVRRWLAKQNVSNHYHLARNARFFTWKGRGLSVVEAAEFFCTEENWADGEDNAFNPQDPATLAHFLSTVPECAPDWSKLRQIHQKAESAEWAGVPTPAIRTAATAVAWLALGKQPGVLVVRGRPVDATGLADLLGHSAEFYNFETINALLSAPGQALVKPLDSAAAEVLAQLASVGLEALRRAEKNRWVEPDDLGGRARVLKLALEGESASRARVDKILAVFATSRDPELARLMADPQPPAWARVLLIITAEDPRRFGYVSKAEHARQRLGELQQRDRELRAAVFWLRLRRVLVAGGPATGPWPIFAGCWLVLVAAGTVVARDVVTTFGVAAALAGVRVLLAWRVRVRARRCDPAAGPWNWRDGPARALTEAQRAWPKAGAHALAGLTRQLVETEKEIVELKPADHSSAPAGVPLFAELWVSLTAAMLLGVLGSIQLAIDCGRNVKDQMTRMTLAQSDPENPLKAADLGTASRPSLAQAEPLSLPGLTPEMRAKVARGEYEIVQEGFGPVLRGPITKWELTAPAAPLPLPVESRGPSTSAQRAFAMVSAELLLRPYGRKAVNVLLVVHVPTRDRFGVMLYNTRERRLMDDETLVVHDQLPDRTWYKFERRTVIYLGQPPEIMPENSLALR